MEDNTEEFEGKNGKSSISADLIRGHISTIILRSLYDRDKYGYEIIDEINEKSHGQYTLKQPTLYSALKRLENQGYIQAYWKTDEVSAGGRRKYYRLTDSGKEITEQNQAEWEFSRTVIDSLISDKNFDFTQPAPTPVDFKILRRATSRVPVVHTEGDDDESEKQPFEDDDDEYAYISDDDSSYSEDDYITIEEEDEDEEDDDDENEESEAEPQISDEQSNEDHESVFETEKPEIQPARADAPVPEFLTYTVEHESKTVYIDDPEKQNNEHETRQTAAYESKTDVKADYIENLYDDRIERGENRTESIDDSALNEQDDLSHRRQSPAETTYEEDRDKKSEKEDIYTLKEQNKYTRQLSRSLHDEESRRIAHENYLKLISKERTRDDSSDVTPYSANMDTSKLVYNLRSEQERDYKNLIDRLFEKTLRNNEKAMYEQAQPQPQPQPVRRTITVNGENSTYYSARDKAAADGLKISTIDSADAAGPAKQITYNKGATLFKCSLIIGVIALLEFTLTLLFSADLNVSGVYPTVILILGLSLMLVCGILYGAGYGRNVRKPTSLKYILTSGIITANIIVIIFIFALIFNIDWSTTTDVLIKFVIPSIVALDIPIFTLSFYLFTK